MRIPGSDVGLVTQTSDGFWGKMILTVDPRRRRYSIVVTIGLVLVIGLADFLLGFQLSILVFYIVPVCLAVAAVGWKFGVFTAIASVASWLVGDFIAGARFDSLLVPFSNALFALGTYLVVVWLLKSLLTLHGEMEERVAQRTEALSRVIKERERLERAILEVGQRERQQIGHSLHDGIGQHFTGTALACQVLGDKLEAKCLDEEEMDARQVVRLIEEGIEKTRRLAKGLLVTEVPEDALLSALQDFAAETARLSRIHCEVRSEGNLKLPDSGTATHLFHIAQESVRNAMRHGKARHVVITLSASGANYGLMVRDDGVGLPSIASHGEGLGLRIMAHRAEIIGWQFQVSASVGGGTLVACRPSDQSLIARVP